MLFRGAHAATLAGAAPPQATAEQDVVVVIRFPTAATLEAWRAPAALQAWDMGNGVRH